VSTHAPAPDGPDQYSATFSRQLSLWPFGTRVLRLYLLVDPLPSDPGLLRSLLRVMQQEHLRSEAGSQTSAISSALLAAHYLLKHKNRESLSQAQVTASAVCAVSRGPTTYIAATGDAAALIWDGSSVTVNRSGARVPRPLGLEHQPRVWLWSASLGAGERLALVCGGGWQDDRVALAKEVLRAGPAALAQAELPLLLAGAEGPARVLVAEGTGKVAGAPHAPRPRLRRTKPSSAREQAAEIVRRERSPASPPRERAVLARLPRGRRWLYPLAAALLLGIVVSSLLTLGEPRHVALARHAEQLLIESERTRDTYAARDLAAQAMQLASQAATAAPEHTHLLARCSRALDQLDRVYSVEPSLLVRLGSDAANIADLAVSDDAVHTLDVADGTVRQYRLDALEQLPAPATILFQTGSVVDGRVLDQPFAIEFTPGGAPTRGGALTVIDRRRVVVQVADGRVVPRPLPSASQWQNLAALGSDRTGSLFVVEAQAKRLLEYRGADQRLVDPPRVLLDAGTAPTFPFDHIVELLPLQTWLVRQDDGVVRRFERQGRELAFEVRPPDQQLGPVSALAGDGTGSVFIADPARARIVQTTAEGRFIRQLRDASGAVFGQLRSLRLTADGRRLVGLSTDGVVAFDLPADVPAPLPAQDDQGDDVSPEATQVVK
jgi:hypothetical protein